MNTGAPNFADSNGQKKTDSTEALIKNTRILVLLGAGGVGKTTTSIVTALMGANQGRRVALLSIDPAKRLAAALGIPLSNQLQPIAIPESMHISGSIDAAMLDQKAVFDAMVRRHAPSMSTAESILAHPVYQAASTNLAGPLEYMALAKLQELAEDPRYDLVVLDTPPDTQALDFLARPNVLAGFMENKVMTWLIRPFLLAGRFGLTKLFSLSEKLMGGIAKVTGVNALQSFGEFLLLMQEVISGFHSSGEHIVKLLHSPDTSFLLVTAPTEAATRSATGILTELKNIGYSLNAILFNKCLPSAVRTNALASDDQNMAIDPAIAMLKRRAEGEERVTAKLLQACSSSGLNPLILQLADEDQPIGSLTAMWHLAERLGQQ
ncbi:MAG: AAA family ATPase [Proteobacteria bacterium]|nr:AAA family ATPase [Pseudomonadota bacterium]